MSITRTFDKPYFTGTSAVLPISAVSPWDVVIDGHGYLVDLVNPQAPPYGMKSIPMLKAMFLQDRGTAPIGEHSLNPDDYWRRSVDDWSAGSGQENLDHHQSLNNRYRISKGIDPWTSGQVSMLNRVVKLTGAGTWAAALLVVAGDRLYFLKDLNGTQTLSYTTDVVGNSFTTVTGSGGDALTTFAGMTTDGFTVWIADATRVHYTTRTIGTFAKFHTSDHVAELIRAAKGRLFTAKDAVVYTHTLTAGSAVATAYFTHPTSDWTWTDIAGGPDSIYFSGYTGDKSAIYSATIKTDGTALDAPVVVATMPDGEIVRSLQEYLGVLLIGTDKGLRVAEIGGSAGQLILGQVIALDHAPLCFEPQDRFVWFGWTNYDADSTGLGRVDLSVFNSDSSNSLGTPAYATDLLADGTQGAVSSVVTFQDRRVFTVSTVGLFTEDPTGKVPSASLSAGWLNYELAEPKVAIKLNLQTRAGAGTVDVLIGADDGTPQPIGSQVTASDSVSAILPIPAIVARNYEVSFVFTRSGTDVSSGPTVDRFTLMVEPQPERRFQFIIPLRMHEDQRDNLGQTVTFVPAEERARFIALCESRQVVVFQDADFAYRSIVDDVEWIPYQQVGFPRTWDGCLVATMKLVN